MSNSQIDFLVRCKALGLENGKLSDWLDEIESLQAENAALKEQVITLEKLQGVALIESLRAETAERREDHMKLVEENHELRQQLAASQLEAKRLRESVDQYLIENDPSNFGCACDLSVGHLCGPCFAHKQQTVLRQALSSPTSTEALDAYVAENVKEATKALVRAIDEHMVVNHQGVFNFGDDPKEALNKIACFEQELGAYFAKEQLAKLTRQRDLAVSAIENLVKQKGRHNTEIAYKKLVDVLAAIKESGATK